MTALDTPPKSPGKRNPAHARIKPEAPPKRAPKSSENGPAKKTKKSFWNYELTPKKIALEEVMNFSRQASSFVKAGIPIVDALAIISQDSQDKKLKEVLSDITTNLQAGSSLTQAINVHASAFPRYFVSMIRSAELTGRLDEVLDQMAKYIDRDIETRRKVKSALTYPAAIGVMSVVTVAVLAGFVLPRFKTFFDSFGAKLPLATRMLVGITNATSSYGLLAVGVLTMLAIAFFAITRTDGGKYARDRFFLSIPKVGVLMSTAIVERFCRILSVMVQAGVPLPDALAVAGETTGNRVYRRGLEEIREAMIQGAGLARPLADTGLFPAAAKQMIRVGEATGTLDDQLSSAAQYYGRELEYKLKRFTDLFEPAVIMFMGLVVGFVAVALVSAMYGIFNQVDI